MRPLDSFRSRVLVFAFAQCLLGPGLPNLARAATAEIWVDDTTSVNGIERDASLKRLAHLLEGFTRENRIDEWDYFGFGASAWRETPFYSMHIPSPPTTQKSEVPACNTNRELSFLKRVQEQCDDLRRRTEAADEARAKKLADDYERSLALVFSTMREALQRHQPRSEADEPCTSVTDMLKRVGDESAKYVFVISDGRETCRRKGLGTLISHRDGKVVFILIGTTKASDSPTPGETFDSSRARLRVAAPWLTVVAPWQLGSDILQ